MSDGDVIERLVTQFDADVTKLTDKIDKMGRKVHASADDWEHRLGHIDLGKAVNTTALTGFNRIMEEGAANAGVFGGALEHLGGVGLGVAAALAAAALAVEQTKKFTEWAAEIERASKALGLSTTQVQEYDHVLEELNIPIDKGREGLAGLEKAIGNVETGMARAQSLRAFTGLLHIDAQDLKGWGDLEQQLPHVLDAVSKLSTEARASVSKSLKIDPEVLNSLVDGRDRISDLVDEAHRYGLVVDEDVIRKGAEANEKLETASKIIDTQLKVAFADLAPAIVEVANALAGAVRQLSDFLELGKDLPDKSEAALQYERQSLQGDRDSAQQWADALGPGDARDTAQQQARDAQTQINQINDVLTSRDLARMLGKDNQPHAGDTPTVSGGGHHAAHSDAASVAKQVQQQLDEANKALQAALANLTSEIGARAQFEQQAVADELKKQLDALDAEAAKIQSDKTISAEKKKQLLAQIELTRQAETAAADAKDDKIQRDEDRANAAQSRALRDALAGYALGASSIYASLGLTPGERHRLATAQLQQEQALARMDLAGDNAERMRGLTPGSDEFSQMQADNLRRMNGLTDLQAAQRVQLQRQQQSPLQSYIDQLTNDTDGPTAFSNVAVKGLQDLNSQFLDAIKNGKDLGQVLTNVFKNIGAELINLGLEKYITLPLAQMMNLVPGQSSPGGSGAGGFFSALMAFLPHFATGTPSAPGGLALVGELGPEVVNIPPGSRVYPNNSLARLGGPSAGMAVAQSTYAPTFDLRGAVMTEDLLRQMNGLAQQHSMQSAVMAVQAARRLVPGEMSRRASLAMR